MCRTYESLNYSHVVMLFSQVGKCFTEKNETHVVAFLSFQYFGGNMQVAKDDKDLSSDLNGNFFYILFVGLTVKVTCVVQHVNKCRRC